MHSPVQRMHLNKDTNPYYFNLPQQDKYFVEREYEDIELTHNNNLHPATNNIKNTRIRGILTCIGGLLIYLSLGSIYTFGNMLPYFASYLAAVNNDDNYLQYISKCNYIFACTICGQSIFFPIGGKLGSKFGIKVTIIIGCAIQSIGGVLCTYFICNNYVLVYLTYGILFGVGIGIAYPNILVVVMKWYPNNKGFVNGIVLCGFGISALIFDKLQTILINPGNLEQDITNGFSDDAIMANFPFIFLYLGACFFVMQIIGVLLMTNPPNNYMQTQPEPIRNSEELPLISQQIIATHVPNDDVDGGYDVMDVIKSVMFWQLYFIFFIDGMIIVVISTQWKMFTNNLGITDDSYLSLIGSISAIFNGFGRILFGFILDKTKSFRFTLGSINIILCILLFLWPFCYGDIMPFVWVCLLFGLFSSNFSIFPTIISFIFGTKNIGVNVGLIFSSQIFSAFIGIYVLDELSEIVNNWKYMCFIVASIQLLGAIVAFSFTNNNNKNNKKYFN